MRERERYRVSEGKRENRKKETITWHRLVLSSNQIAGFPRRPLALWSEISTR